MIEIHNLSFAFDQTPIFSQLSLTIEKGEILSIIGPNGCGKSTLLRLLRGHLRPQSGDIFWNNIPLQQYAARELARQVAVVPQSTRIDFSYSVRELVAMGRYPHRSGLLSFAGAADEKAINQALGLADVIDLAQRQVTQLSGGELQRTLLARALAQETGVLFLDEATSHLDIDHRLELTELLARLNREQGKTIVQISHDLDLAAAISHRILMLSAHGRIVALGSPAEVITSANLRQLFHVDLRVEANPYTGTPQITPLINTLVSSLQHCKAHLICGGGSGRILLRRLHLAQAQLTTGPLNQGDSDHSLAAALDIPTIVESPFHPYSAGTLLQARQRIDAADLIVIASVCWGEGNLACLDLALEKILAGKTVYLVDPRRANDYTGGKAWNKIERLNHLGAHVVDNEEQLLTALQHRH